MIYTDDDFKIVLDIAREEYKYIKDDLLRESNARIGATCAIVGTSLHDEFYNNLVKFHCYLIECDFINTINELKKDILIKVKNNVH